MIEIHSYVEGELGERMLFSVAHGWGQSSNQLAWVYEVASAVDTFIIRVEVYDKVTCEEWWSGRMLSREWSTWHTEMLDRRNTGYKTSYRVRVVSGISQQRLKEIIRIALRSFVFKWKE